MKINATLNFDRSEIRAIESLGLRFNDFINETMNESVDGFQGFINNIKIDSTVKSKANYLAFKLHFTDTLEVEVTFETHQIEDICELNIELMNMVTPAIVAYNKLIADLKNADDSKFMAIANRIKDSTRVTERNINKSFAERK